MLMAAPAAIVSKYPIRLAIKGIAIKAITSLNTFDKKATVPSSADIGVIIIADKVYQDKPDAMASEPNKSILNIKLHTIPPVKLPTIVAAGTIRILKPTFFKFLNISLLLPKSIPTKNKSKQRPMSNNNPVFSYTASGIINKPDTIPSTNAINIFLVIFASCNIYISNKLFSRNINKQDTK